RAAGWSVAAAVLIGVGVSAAVVNGRIQTADAARHDAALAANRATDARATYDRSCSVVIADRDRFTRAQKACDDVVTEWVGAEKTALAPGDRRPAVRVTRPVAL